MSIDDADGALRIIEDARLRIHDRLREAVAEHVQTRVDLAAIDDDTIDQLADDAAARAGSSLWRIAIAEAAADAYGLTVRDALAHPTVRSAEQLAGVQAEADPADEYLADLQNSRIEAATVPWEVPDDDEPLTDVPADLDVPEPAPVAPEAAPTEIVAVPAEPAAVIEAPAPVVEPTPPAPAQPAVAALRVAAAHTSGIESLATGDDDIELSLSDAGLDVLRRSSGDAIGRLDWDQITGIEVQQVKRGRRGKRKPRSLVVKTGGGQAVFELSGLSPEDVEAHVEPALQRLRSAGILAS